MAAITDADIQHRYTTATGPGNSTAGTGPTSLGGFISTTQIPDAVAGSLWDDVTGDENANLDVEYRCEGRYNSNAANVWTGVKAWISSEVAGGANIAIGVDPTAASALASAGAQMVSVADRTPLPPELPSPRPRPRLRGSPWATSGWARSRACGGGGRPRTRQHCRPTASW